MAITLRESEIGGKGNFATKRIAKGETIRVLTGRRLSGEAAVSESAYDTPGDADFLQIGPNTYIDLDESSYFINHSCDPNAAIRGESDLFAIRDIEAEEEVTLDYATVTGTESEWRGMDCACGVPNCRSQIGDISSLPKERLEAYYNMGALPEFLMEQVQRGFPLGRS